MNSYSRKSSSPFFHPLTAWIGENVIGDYYSLHSKKSNFIYVASTDVIALAIGKFYLLDQILKDFAEIKNDLKITSMFSYQKFILKPLLILKNKYLDEQNRKYGRSGDEIRLIVNRMLP